MGSSRQPRVCIRVDRVGALDGLRALAILPVVVFHAASVLQYPIKNLGLAGGPVLHGWMGVDLFFALSGFLITSLWIEEEQSRESSSWKKPMLRFYVRRVLRILPPFYTVFFIELAAFATFASVHPLATAVRHHPSRVLPYVFFYMNYVPSHARAGHAFALEWTLCVEEHFYLLWPTILVLARSRRTRLGIALGACVLIALLRIVMVGYGVKQGWTTFGMVNRASHFRVDSILWGAVAALSLEELALYVSFRRAGLLVALCGVLALALSGEMSVVHPPTVLGTGVGLTVLAIFAALLTVEVVVAPETPLARLLAWRPLRIIGLLSYTIYLVHPVCSEIALRAVFPLWGSSSPWNFALIYAVTVVISVGVAALLYVAIERPARWLRRRLELRLA